MDQKIINNAMLFAAKYFNESCHNFGKPVYFHCIKVGMTLFDLGYEEKIIVVISNYKERSKSPFERMVLGENGSKKVISSIITKKPKINKVVLYYREKASKVKTTLYPTNITLATQERNKQIIQLARHPYFVHTVEITSKTPRYFRQVRVKSGHKVIGHGNIWQLSNQDKGINIFGDERLKKQGF